MQSNILSLENLNSFLEQNTEFDNFKVFLKSKNITVKQFFANGKFGITWKPYQMIVKPKHQFIPGVCHLSVVSFPVQSEKMSDEKLTDNCRIDVSEMIDSDEDIDREYTVTKECAEMDHVLNSTHIPEVPVKGRRKIVKS